MKSWYCVQTKVRQEGDAANHLEQQGYEVYAPLTYSDKRKAKKQEVEPLFPGYIFTLLDEHVGDWSPIRSTYGVVKLVAFGERPAKVPASMIAELRNAESDQGIHLIPGIEYQTNDPVQVKSGPFKYCKAIFKTKNRDRVTLLMDIMGKETMIQMGYKNIEPLS